VPQQRVDIKQNHGTVRCVVAAKTYKIMQDGFFLLMVIASNGTGPSSPFRDISGKKTGKMAEFKYRGKNYHLIFNILILEPCPCSAQIWC
jgi:hypothetical protein